RRQGRGRADALRPRTGKQKSLGACSQALLYARTDRGLLDVLADEGQHLLEGVADLGEVRRMAGLAVAVEVMQLDVAAGLLVVGGEARRLGVGAFEILVLVVVQDIAAALVPDRRRQRDLLAALEDEHRIAFGHVLLAAPELMMLVDDSRRPGRRIGQRTLPLGETITAERVD